MKTPEKYYEGRGGKKRKSSLADEDHKHNIPKFEMDTSDFEVCNSKPTAIISQRMEPTKLAETAATMRGDKDKSEHFIHNSALEGRRLLQAFGTVMSVPTDGNCGYHVLINLLISAGLISASSNTTNLRKDIYEYATKNSHIFLGKEKMGRDSVFVRSNGDYGYPTAGRKSSDPRVVRAKIHNDDVTP